MKTLIVILTVLGLPVSLFAQSGSLSQPSLAPSEVSVWNSTGVTLKFSITGNTCAPLLSESLQPDSTNTYNCKDATFFNISIATTAHDGTVVTKNYSLTPEKRYQLFADSQGIFDVAEIQAR